MSTTAQEIAGAFGLRQDGNAYRGRCPSCGYEGTFSVSNGDNRPVWFCHSCQDGAALGAVIRATLGDDAIGPGPTALTNPAALETRDAERRAKREQSKAKALAIWDGAQPFACSPAQAYLAARGLPDVVSDALRYGPRVFNAEMKRQASAMVAAVTIPTTGEMVAVHRTWIADDGSDKLRSLEAAKKSLGPIAGAAIELEPHRPGEPLVIGEGIETSLSARVLLGRGAAWAAIAAGNMERIRLPDAVERVVVAADSDAVGQRAAWAAAARWKAEGRDVKVATPKVGDHNDVLLARQRGGAPHA